MIKIEHNVATGEITEIELTATEIKEIEKATAKDTAEEGKLKAGLLAKAAAKTALLKKLGITEEEAKLLLG